MGSEYDHEEFRLNMRRNGFEVEEYERRFGDSRPAVRTEGQRQLQEVIRATPVILDWDQLGMGLIVYPAARAPKVQPIPVGSLVEVILDEGDPESRSFKAHVVEVLDPAEVGRHNLKLVEVGTDDGPLQYAPDEVRVIALPKEA